MDVLSPEPPSFLDPETRGRRLVILGLAYCRKNLFREGESRLQQAAATLPTGRRDLHAEQAMMSGVCAMSQREEHKANDYFHRAIELGSNSDPFIAASALGNLGYMASQKGVYDRALTIFQQVLAVSDSPSIQEKAMGNIGESYAQLGDFLSSVEYSRRAAELAGRLGRTDDQVAWLLNVGHSFMAMRESDSAENYLQQALSLARKLGDHDTESISLNNLVNLALGQHQVPKAEEYWREEGMVQGTSPRAKRYARVDEAYLAAERKDYAREKSILDSLIRDSGVDPALHAVLLGKLAQLYVIQHKTVLAQQTFLRSIDEAEGTRSKISEDYRISFLDESPFYDNYIRFLANQNKIAEALQVSERGRSLTLLEGLSPENKRHSRINARNIQNYLKQNHQVVLTYWVTNDETLLWVVTPSHIKLFRLPGQASLYQQLGAANKEIQNRAQLPDSAEGQALYRALIAPAEKVIPRGSRVIVVPSRVLCLVDFEALVVPGPKPHYWIEDVEVENASSLSLLLLNRGKTGPAPEKELLLIGAPAEANKKDFPALPHAAEEIQEIAPHFAAPARTVISGPNATPQSYFDSNPEQYRLIHFVSHGTANERNPLESAIVLSPGKESYMLYAGQIMKRPIQADLVTISACYGAGLRWYSNESTVGLGWAFIRAGAHHVIASLWEVDDEGTPDFMDHFYAKLTAGKRCAEALREVKLEMINSPGPHRHPYFWASLQLYAGS